MSIQPVSSSQREELQAAVLRLRAFEARLMRPIQQRALRQRFPTCQSAASAEVPPVSNVAAWVAAQAPGHDPEPAAKVSGSVSTPSSPADQPAIVPPESSVAMRQRIQTPSKSRLSGPAAGQGVFARLARWRRLLGAAVLRVARAFGGRLIRGIRQRLSMSKAQAQSKASDCASAGNRKGGGR